MLAGIYLHIVITLHKYCVILPRQLRHALHLNLLCRTPLFHNQVSTEHRYEFRKKLHNILKFWNIIRNSQYPSKDDQNCIRQLYYTWVISVRYQLPPRFLVCKRKGFSKERITPRYGSHFRYFSMEKLGNTAVYHRTWPMHTNKVGRATFMAHYEKHTTYQ
jgi:hypothetical protein